ncbi:hypothetical protein B0T11DRAFT_144190 [Plectosphaerella cucumerina]|uniref:Uncharacterized protein n=1 Tax=Plectosphaerella cucumerina TaxID=40658 RepID=A0A8K0T6T6_9PEZI|nr:hypothetical protein B0T11DRAFT_144190 [Plectosphaerella cucumerina]
MPRCVGGERPFCLSLSHVFLFFLFLLPPLSAASTASSAAFSHTHTHISSHTPTLTLTHAPTYVVRPTARQAPSPPTTTSLTSTDLASPACTGNRPDRPLTSLCTTFAHAPPLAPVAPRRSATRNPVSCRTRSTSSSPPASPLSLPAPSLDLSRTLLFLLSPRLTGTNPPLTSTSSTRGALRKRGGNLGRRGPDSSGNSRVTTASHSRGRTTSRRYLLGATLSQKQ